MSEEQINLAIARALGWHSIHTSKTGIKGMKGPFRRFMPIPKYCTDLNAMHEAEKVLTDDQREVFYPKNLGAWQSPFNVIYATARQRAEAFLRTLGKCEEVQA